jgi:hypothetical protein
MGLKELIKKLAELGFVTKKPKPLYVFLLFFAYFMIWIVVFILYIKYDMTTLRLWVIVLGILTLITLIHSILHRYVVKVIGEPEDTFKNI